MATETLQLVNPQNCRKEDLPDLVSLMEDLVLKKPNGAELLLQLRRLGNRELKVDYIGRQESNGTSALRSKAERLYEMLTLS